VARVQGCRPPAGGWRASLTVNELQDGTGFLVAPPLEQHRFVRFDVGEKCGEALGRNGSRDVVRAVERP